ncbi:MAG: hypothetical protein WA840_12550 [Caulobacteraceae bacterium]
MKLTTGQLTALRNLLRKKSGEEVDWINIADARALTELGLAERDQAGWHITLSGEEALKGDIEDEAVAILSTPISMEQRRRPDAG